MKWIILTLKLAIKILNTASSALANFDENVVGWDDETASVLEDVKNRLQTIIDANPVDLEARGYDEIEAFGNKILVQIDAHKTADFPKAEKVEKAIALEQSLYDSAKVFQAQHGKDAELLKNLKLQAAEKRGEIENLPE